MGYRSEVRCLIYGPKDKMRAFITLNTIITPSQVFAPTTIEDDFAKGSDVKLI